MGKPFQSGGCWEARNQESSCPITHSNFFTESSLVPPCHVWQKTRLPPCHRKLWSLSSLQQAPSTPGACPALCMSRINAFTLGAFAQAFPPCFLAICSSNSSSSGNLFDLHRHNHTCFPQTYKRCPHVCICRLVDCARGCA